MSWFDFLRRGAAKEDVRDTLRLSLEEFESIPIRDRSDPQTGEIGDQWRVSRRRFTQNNYKARYDCGWDYFTVLGFHDSDRIIIYSMRLEAWENGRRVY